MFSRIPTYYQTRKVLAESVDGFATLYAGYVHVMVCYHTGSQSEDNADGTRALN